MREAQKTRRTWAAMCGLFAALAACLDLRHYLEMRERVSLAYDPSEDWPEGGV
jgi:hypothetical protein